MLNQLRLPDGNYTTDVDLFSAEWDKLRKPFEDMGFRICGFDPHIALCDAVTGEGHFQLPLYAARKFISLKAAAGSPVADLRGESPREP